MNTELNEETETLDTTPSFADEAMHKIAITLTVLVVVEVAKFAGGKVVAAVKAHRANKLTTTEA